MDTDISEAEMLFKELSCKILNAKNLFNNHLIATIVCNQVFSLDNVISLLISENIWTEYKRAGNGKWILKMEWSE